MNKPDNILIIDDKPDNLRLLNELLRSENCHVRTFTSGEMALEAIRNDIPDLILLDVSMPDMDGFEVCEQIKAIPMFADIPIIFLTGKTEKKDIIRGFEIGGQDYVTKPFNDKELLARIHTHLSLKKQKESLENMNSILEEKVTQRTKELLEANAHLAKLGKAKSDFLGLISHEMRTPLNGLKLLEFIDADKLDEDQRLMLSMSMESADRLERFAEIALLITSLRSEFFEVNKETILVTHLMDYAVSAQKSSAAMKKVGIHIENKEDLFLSGDIKLLRICMDLLLENSIKFTPEGGDVFIRTYKKEDCLYIEMEDQGPGFSEKSIKEFKTLFYTDDFMSHQKGLGLGLATADLIIVAHGGEMKLSNTPEGGGLVRISLSREKL